MFCFSKTCRICKNSTMYYKLTYNVKKHLDRLFFDVFPNMIDSKLNSVLTNLCENCVDQLVKFEEFRKHCVNSDEVFNRYWNQLHYPNGDFAELECLIELKNEERKIPDKYISNNICNTNCLLVNPCDIKTEPTEIDDHLNEYCNIQNSKKVPTPQEQAGAVELLNSATNQNTSTNISNNQIRCEHSYELRNEGSQIPHNINNNERILNSRDIKKEPIDIDIVKHELEDNTQNSNLQNASYISEEVLVPQEPQEEITSEQAVELPNSSANQILSEHSYSKAAPSTIAQLPHPCTIEKFKCDNCTKYFPDNSSLFNHIRNETGGEPLECLKCGKLFSLGINLNRHIFTHIEETKKHKKLFKCDECWRSFSRKKYLENHRSTVHSDTFSSDMFVGSKKSLPSTITPSSSQTSSPKKKSYRIYISKLRSHTSIYAKRNTLISPNNNNTYISHFFNCVPEK